MVSMSFVVRQAAALVFFAVLVGLACAPEPKPCVLSPQGTRELSLDYGQAVVLAPALCPSVKRASLQYQWSVDKTVVSTAEKHRFLACPRYNGKRTSVRVELTEGKTRTVVGWSIRVRDVAPKHRHCAPGFHPKDALAVIQSGAFYAQGGKPGFREAAACLDRALEDYPCDVEVAFWAAYAHLLMFLQQAPAQIFLSTQSEETLSGLIDTVIDPLIARYSLLSAELPADFVGHASNFDFRFVGGLGIVMHPGGEWDRGDVLAIDAGLNLFKGTFKFASAYVGAIDFVQMLASGDLGSLTRATSFGRFAPGFQDRLIKALDTDPRFLTLYEGGDGEKRLTAARWAFVEGFTKLNAAVTFVKGERDDQRDDIFRYFDCGADGVCPPDQSRDANLGDAGEPLVKDANGDGRYNPATDAYVDRNQNGRYDAAWAVSGSDAGENDGQYSEGETIGTDIFSGAITRLGVAVTPLAQEFLADLARNIRGPDPLDLGKYLQLTQSQIVQLAVLGGLNLPDIRLSRWFEGPRNPRDFLPLWSHSKRRFITDSEEEPWDDLGFDRVVNANEGALTGNPRCSGERAYALQVADPSADDFDPETNPDDGCDNDEDGLVDETDGAGRSTDLGTEGNLIFDFLDRNGNGRHDGCFDPNSPACEKSEHWYDDGVWTGGKLLTNTRANGKWDALDIEHVWPKGFDVGGREVETQRDPRNGALQDGLQPLIDPVYYFFPDAQFNGVIIFANPTVNVNSEPLNDNAELMRFLSKFVQSGRKSVK